MQCTVIVRSEAGDRFVARPLGLPEFETTAPTEAEAVAGVTRKLGEWVRGVTVVEVTVPTGNPWLDTAGRSAEDPLFEEYLEEIRRYRAAVEDAG